MSDNHRATGNRDTRLENFTAELTLAAYGVALRHGTVGTWVDLELDLWMALARTVRRWDQRPPPNSEVVLVDDWAGGQGEAVNGDIRDGLADWHYEQEALSGE
jgi:hypothetical protein